MKTFTTIKHCIYTLSFLTNQPNKQNHKCLMSKTHFHIVLVFENKKGAETEFAIEIAGLKNSFCVKLLREPEQMECKEDTCWYLNASSTVGFERELHL